MKTAFALLLAVLLTTSCSVMSRQVRHDAVATPPFPTLISHADAYRGKTVIVGGYVLKVENEPNRTRLTLLQAPLHLGGQPGGRDRSRGRLLVTTPQFLDPEIYTKDRQVTVAGKVVGSSIDKDDRSPVPYLELTAREIHLWPQYKPIENRYRFPYGDPFWDDDPFWYWDDPFYGWHRPFYFHGSAYGRYLHRRHRRW